MAHSEALPIIEKLIPDLALELVNDHEVLGVAATTNAFAWGLDDYDNLKAWFEGHGKIAFSVKVFLYGEHDNDKPFCGSQVIIQVKGKLKYEDNWKIDSYEIEEVKLTDF